MNKSFNKEAFIDYIFSKVKNIIEYEHVYAIIDILFDEIRNDLLSSFKFKIKNFATIKIKDTTSRPHIDVVRKQVVYCKPHKILRIILDEPLKRKLLASIDIDKTFDRA